MTALILIFIGLGEGLVVGSSFGIFFSALGIITRLAQLTKTPDFLSYYAAAIVLGAIGVMTITFFQWSFLVPQVIIILVGLAMGCFVGLLAAALTEVLNVIPLISRRLKMQDYVEAIFFFFILGKVLGSLLYWLYFA